MVEDEFIKSSIIESLNLNQNLSFKIQNSNCYPTHNDNRRSQQKSTTRLSKQFTTSQLHCNIINTTSKNNKFSI